MVSAVESVMVSHVLLDKFHLTCGPRGKGGCRDVSTALGLQTYPPRRAHPTASVSGRGRAFNVDVALTVDVGRLTGGGYGPLNWNRSGPVFVAVSQPRPRDEFIAAYRNLATTKTNASAQIRIREEG
ncbi:MAG: hypothetical protein DMG12_21345 [Acidobacteria bacterium]|nr:MAG: hypothetical protein DMG12_21345 [Acidobacteriota bacterium]